MRWEAMVVGSETGEGCAAAAAGRAPARAGGGLGRGPEVEKRTTWWKKRERPRSQVDGSAELPV